MAEDPKRNAPGDGKKKVRKQVVTGRLSVDREPRDSDEAAKMVRSGQFADAAARLNHLVREKPDDFFAWRLLAAAETARRHFQEALAAIDRALALKPERWGFRVARANILSDLGDYERSLPLFEKLHQEKPDDISVLNGLKTGHYYAGDPEKALEFGGRALRLLDQGASAIDLPPLDRHEHKSVHRQKRVLAFTLFGTNPVYLYGAMINARLAHYLFPGWSCRMYVGDDVPSGVVADLKRTGAEVISGNVLFPEIPPYFWRFLVADDPNVRLFVCRDCDARLTVRDVLAVATWLDRGQPFHVVRDHVLHNMPLLAGLWGGSAAYTWNMRSRIRDFLVHGIDNTYGADQRFLAQCIWPLIRDRCVRMDRYYSLAGNEPIPVFAINADKGHMGMGVAGEKLLKKEARLFGIPWPIA